MTEYQVAVQQKLAALVQDQRKQQALIREANSSLRIVPGGGCRGLIERLWRERPNAMRERQTLIDKEQEIASQIVNLKREAGEAIQRAWSITFVEVARRLLPPDLFSQITREVSALRSSTKSIPQQTANRQPTVTYRKRSATMREAAPRLRYPGGPSRRP